MINSRGGEGWGAQHKRSACQSTNKRDRCHPSLEGVGWRGLADGDGKWRENKAVERHSVGKKGQRRTWGKKKAQAYRVRTKTGKGWLGKAVGLAQDMVWADRTEVTLGCRSMVLLGKVGWTSPDTGPKPGKATHLEHQCKTSKIRMDFPGEARG